jgi:translation elongation factor EF-1alpha
MTTIFCDAAENTVRRVVNSYGKIRTFNNGGYRIGVCDANGHEARFYNTRVDNSFSAEAFAILKAVECAAEWGYTDVVVMSDCAHAYGRTKNRDASKYSWVADKIAAERGVTFRVEAIAGADNPADKVSRTEGE